MTWRPLSISPSISLTISPTISFFVSYDVASPIYQSLIPEQRDPFDELDMFRRVALEGFKYCYSYNDICEVEEVVGIIAKLG